jgi:hypothetical protein
MTYTKVFDVAEQGYSFLWFPTLGAVFVVIAALFVVFRRYLRPRFLQFAPIVAVGVGVLWTLASILFTTLPHARLVSALRDGRCSVVEGVVRDFRPMPQSGHGQESFTVNGISFVYSDFVVTPGFRQTQFRHGPIREGLRVRIHFWSSHIARLEIET